MSDIELSRGSEKGPSLLSGYLPEQEYCEQAKVSKRKARLDRQLGISPPYIRWNGQIWYSEDGFRAHIKALEQHPVRMRRSRTSAEAA